METIGGKYDDDNLGGNLRIRDLFGSLFTYGSKMGYNDNIDDKWMD